MMKIALLAVLVAAAHASNERDRMYYEEKFYNWLSFFKMTPPTGKPECGSISPELTLLLSFRIIYPMPPLSYQPM
jgi:hypothetical protein